MTNSRTRNTRRSLALTAFGALLAAGIITANTAHADPEPPGCVDPNTSLPCSSQLQDINAAINRELQKILGGTLTAPGR